MAEAHHVLAIDQGTTSSRALVFDRRRAPVARTQRELEQHYPRAGWVEHDAEEIWHDTLRSARGARRPAVDARGHRRALASPTSARPWCCGTARPAPVAPRDRLAGPAHRRALARLSAAGHEALVREHTGLVIDPYFSATKLAWLLNEVAGARDAAERGELASAPSIRS